jgi:serine phosphatase RsbU (regulator of sigma subunit)
VTDETVPALRRLLPVRRATALLAPFGPLLGRLRVSLEDADGVALATMAGPGATSSPAVDAGDRTSWCVGEVPVAHVRVHPSPAGDTENAVAALVRQTLVDALENAHARRSITAETLERYREIHLLYRVGEALAGTLDATEVPRRVLAEARAVIAAEAGAVWLAHEGESGSVVADREDVDWIDLVARTRAALADPGRGAVLGADGALGPRIWAPLVSGEADLGGVLLVRSMGAADFTAGDAKLLAALATQAAAFLDNARLHRLALAQERLERELQLAYEVQSRLMPRGHVVHPGWDVAAHWQPAREVSGDFYDLIPLGDELGLVVADVADKGMPAALFMAVVRSLLRASAGPERSPAEAVAQTNRWACRDASDGMFVTLWYGQFHVDGRLRYVNAGHNPPLVLRHDGSVERLSRTGILVGWDPDVAFGEGEVRLDEGDLFVGYTDGVTEALDPAGDVYGEERFERVLQGARERGAQATLDAVRHDLAAFTADAPAFDDVTLVVVGRRDAKPAEGA